MKDVVTFKTTGGLNRTWKFLKFLSSKSYYRNLERYAKRGVAALMESTPMDTGVTAQSWDYKITIGQNETRVEWINSNTTEDGIPIVILLRYGHGTKNGGYVQGYDFISPAIQPIFDDMVKQMWREVQKA